MYKTTYEHFWAGRVLPDGGSKSGQMLPDGVKIGPDAPG